MMENKLYSKFQEETLIYKIAMDLDKISQYFCVRVNVYNSLKKKRTLFHLLGNVRFLFYVVQREDRYMILFLFYKVATTI